MYWLKIKRDISVCHMSVSFQISQILKVCLSDISVGGLDSFIIRPLALSLNLSYIRSDQRNLAFLACKCRLFCLFGLQRTFESKGHGCLHAWGGRSLLFHRRMKLGIFWCLKVFWRRSSRKAWTTAYRIQLPPFGFSATLSSLCRWAQYPSRKYQQLHIPRNLRTHAHAMLL